MNSTNGTAKVFTASNANSFQENFLLQTPTRQLATLLNRSTRPISSTHPQRQMPSSSKTEINLSQFNKIRFHGVKYHQFSITDWWEAIGFGYEFQRR